MKYDSGSQVIIDEYNKRGWVREISDVYPNRYLVCFMNPNSDIVNVCYATDDNLSEVTCQYTGNICNYRASISARDKACEECRGNR